VLAGRMFSEDHAFPAWIPWLVGHGSSLASSAFWNL